MITRGGGKCFILGWILCFINIEMLKACLKYGGIPLTRHHEAILPFWLLDIFLTGELWDLGGLVKFNGRWVAGVEFIE